MIVVEVVEVVEAVALLVAVTRMLHYIHISGGVASHDLAKRSSMNDPIICRRIKPERVRGAPLGVNKVAAPKLGDCS